MSDNNIPFIWEQIIPQISSKIPSSREGSICTFVTEKNSIIVFGGQSSQGTNRYCDLYSFDIITKQWNAEKAKGLSPPSLSHAACWFDFPYLFFQGGRSNQDKSLSDTYFLDVETYTWRKLFTMEQPSSRYGHKAVRNEDKQAYIFGGCNIGKKESRYLNDLHKCEYKSIKIVEGEESNVNGASWITNVACKGVKPAGRKGHSMILMNNNIYLFGGELKQGISDDNMYKFSIDDKEWSSISITGDRLPLNAYSCLIQLGTTNIVMIGGKRKEEITNEIYSIDIKASECVKGIQSGNGPDRRADYMSCYDKDNNIIIFGGSNTEGLCPMNLYLLREIKGSISNKQTKEEKVIKINQIEKISNEAEMTHQISSRQQNMIHQPQIISQPQFKPSKTPTPQKKAFQSIEQSNLLQKLEVPLHKSCKEEVNQLKLLQAEFFKEYEKNRKISQIYQENLYVIDQYQKRDVESALIQIEKAKQAKEKEKEIEKSKEIKELNVIINDYLNLHKKRVSYILDLLCAYVEDMRRIDEAILQTYNTDMGSYFINYDIFNEKRNSYSEQLKRFFRELQTYTKYEIDLHNDITRKMNEKRQKGYIEGNQSTISFREGIEGDQIDYNNN